VVAYVALFVAATGTAAAATGGTFVLGKSNSAGQTTALRNTGSGPALRLQAPSKHTAPLSVSGNTTNVRGLNADLLHGVHSKPLHRAGHTHCGRGGTVAGVHPGGRTSCGPTVLWAVVQAAGSLSRGTSGTRAKAISTGSYEVDFGMNVRGCSYVGNVGD